MPATGFGVSAAPQRQAGLFAALSAAGPIATALHTSAAGAAQDPALRKVWEFVASATTVAPYVIIGAGSEGPLDAFGRAGTAGVEALRVVADTAYQARSIYAVIKQELESTTALSVAGHAVGDVACSLIAVRRDPDTGRALLDFDVTILTRKVVA